MATFATPPLHRRPLAIAPEGWAALVLLLAAFLIRAVHFGDPALQTDEQFYLLVGERMRHGTLPYVDIWDRKPIGLFLIYAGASALGGSGILPYQLLATACAAGTALCIFALSRRLAGTKGATVGGVLYLLWLEIAEGGGGQAPVFYNLAMAGAALLLITHGSRGTRGRAFAAMLLVGVAIQIKYSAVFEGFFFGLVATAQAWRRDPRTAFIEVPVLALTALAPTLAAVGFYAAIGHLPEYWFANFTSIFRRGQTPTTDLHRRGVEALLHLVPLAVCAFASIGHLLHADRSRETMIWLIFMAAWCATALAGFFALGVLYPHYLLPVFLPFAALATPIFRRRPIGPVLLAIAAWLPASHLDWPDLGTTARSRRQIAALKAFVPAEVSRGCMQMFDGPPILYHLTYACTVSRFVFPDHLSAANENGAIGVDAATEVHRILAARPLVITMGEIALRPANEQTTSIMRKGLARAYRLAGKAPVGEQMVAVYIRR